MSEEVIKTEEEQRQPTAERPYSNMEEAVRFYGEKGHTPEQIARHTGYDLMKIRYKMKELDMIEGNLITQAQVLKLVSCIFDEELTYEDIGKKFGITKQAVENFRIKGTNMGVPFPDRSGGTGRRTIR